MYPLAPPTWPEASCATGISWDHPGLPIRGRNCGQHHWVSLCLCCTPDQAHWPASHISHQITEGRVVQGYRCYSGPRSSFSVQSVFLGALLSLPWRPCSGRMGLLQQWSCTTGLCLESLIQGMNHQPSKAEMTAHSQLNSYCPWHRWALDGEDSQILEYLWLLWDLGLAFLLGLAGWSHPTHI